MANTTPISLADICQIPPIRIPTTHGRLGWVPLPECGRGTAGILYSCLWTIFLCIWSSFHPNVGRTADSTRRIYWARFGWVLLGLFAPESIASFAIGEFYQARTLQKHIRGLLKHPDAWPLKFCFFANSGGIVVNEDGEERALQTPDDFDGEERKCGRSKMIELPTTYGKILADKTKSGPFIKGLAVVQILWFAAQIAGRHRQNGLLSLNITSLEIMTAGFIVCTIIQYVFWWTKPQGVYYPIIVRPDSALVTTTSPEQSIAPHITTVKPMHSLIIHGPQKITHPPSLEQPVTTSTRPLDRYKTFMEGFLGMYKLKASERDPMARLQVFVLSLLSTISFGGLNLVAWNFSFPTSLESFLWKFSCIGMLVLPIAFATTAHFWESGSTRSYVVLALIALSYGVIRLYVIVECFLALRSEPAQVYCSTYWSSYIPHI